MTPAEEHFVPIESFVKNEICNKQDINIFYTLDETPVTQSTYDKLLWILTLFLSRICSQNINPAYAKFQIKNYNK